MAGSVWSGQLTFGLVSFPVRLFPAARKERVKMHYLRQTRSAVTPAEEARDDEPPAQPETSFRPESMEDAPPPVARVQQGLMSAEDQRPLNRQELLKGYEVAPEQYVTFSNEELRKLRPATSPDMQILRSVRLAEIDPLYFETSYYVSPDRGAERPYALLFAALKETQYVAVAKVAMHGREHIVVVRPGQKGLVAHTMFYNDEVRADREFQTSVTEVAPKELALAKTFVEAIAGPFAPEEFKDSYREQIQSLISSKVERKEVAATASAEQPVAAPVVDIMEALKKSLELAKKPAKTETQIKRRPPEKVTELKSKAQKRKA